MPPDMTMPEFIAITCDRSRRGYREVFRLGRFDQSNLWVIFGQSSERRYHSLRCNVHVMTCAIKLTRDAMNADTGFPKRTTAGSASGPVWGRNTLNGDAAYPSSFDRKGAIAPNLQ